jgi:hypothetical protein
MDEKVSSIRNQEICKENSPKLEPLIDTTTAQVAKYIM